MYADSTKGVACYRSDCLGGIRKSAMVIVIGMFMLANTGACIKENLAAKIAQRVFLHLFYFDGNLDGLLGQLILRACRWRFEHPSQIKQTSTYPGGLRLDRHRACWQGAQCKVNFLEDF